jgi:hypothetical protein
MARVLVGTVGGLFVWSGDGVEEPVLRGHSVGPIALGGDGGAWAVVDGRALWRSGDHVEWTEVATWDGPALTCVAPVDGAAIAGTVEAHVVRATADGRIEQLDGFDALPERGKWYTPWGAPADVRSIAEGDGTVYVNVHVGGVAASSGGASGASWAALEGVDIDVDVHQVITGPDGLVLVATGAAGLGVSRDAGATWEWSEKGLHGTYLRAVALAGDTILVSASTGPFAKQSAVYRRDLAGGDFVRCEQGVPDWFAGQVDTHMLAATDDTVALAAADGALYLSADRGVTWKTAATDLGSARGVAIAA